MDGLIVHREPESKFPTMVVAFAGWPDAGEAATRAVRYLVRKLGATKFAEIDPEEFYDFTAVRPHIRTGRGGQRYIRWQTNDFYYYEAPDPSRNLVLYIGTEPNLRWKTFASLLVRVARMAGVRLVISLGALLDAVPHTREPGVTGRATSEELAQKVEWLGVGRSGYQGPTGIHSVFMEACLREGLEHASLWGHCPHYVNTSPNPRVSHALLVRLRSLVDIDVDLEELRLAGETFEAEITKAIANQPDVSGYVQRLEEKYDAAFQASEAEGVPSPEDMVRELEEFLRNQRRRQEEGDQG